MFTFLICTVRENKNNACKPTYVNVLFLKYQINIVIALLSKPLKPNPCWARSGLDFRVDLPRLHEGPEELPLVSPATTAVAALVPHGQSDDGILAGLLDVGFRGLRSIYIDLGEVVGHGGEGVHGAVVASSVAAGLTTGPRGVADRFDGIRIAEANLLGVNDHSQDLQVRWLGHEEVHAVLEAFFLFRLQGRRGHAHQQCLCVLRLDGMIVLVVSRVQPLLEEPHSCEA